MGTLLPALLVYSLAMEYIEKTGCSSLWARSPFTKMASLSMHRHKAACNTHCTMHYPGHTGGYLRGKTSD